MVCVERAEFASLYLRYSLFSVCTRTAPPATCELRRVTVNHFKFSGELLQSGGPYGDEVF